MTTCWRSPRPHRPASRSSRLRNGVVHIPRLARTPTLTPPDAPAWQLGTPRKGDLAYLALLPSDADATLAPGQIRVQVRAAGLNFRDIVVALGVIADEGMGSEAAGIVVDTGPETRYVAATR